MRRLQCSARPCWLLITCLSIVPILPGCCGTSARPCEEELDIETLNNVSERYDSIQDSSVKQAFLRTCQNSQSAKEFLLNKYIDAVAKKCPDINALFMDGSETAATLRRTQGWFQFTTDYCEAYVSIWIPGVMRNMLRTAGWREDVEGVDVIVNLQNALRDIGYCRVSIPSIPNKVFTILSTAELMLGCAEKTSLPMPWQHSPYLPCCLIEDAATVGCRKSAQALPDGNINLSSALANAMSFPFEWKN